MEIRFLKIAEDELFDACGYYENQLPNLGRQLYNEVKTAIKIIQEYPAAWKQVGKNTRKCLLKRFPYSIYYMSLFLFVFFEVRCKLLFFGVNRCSGGQLILKLSSKADLPS